MKVITEIKRSDLVFFNLRVFLKLRSTYITFVILMIGSFLFLIFLKGFPVTPIDWIASTLGSIGGGIFGTLFGFIFSLISILLLSNKSNGTLGEHEYEITDTGLFEKTEVNEGLTKWEGIQGIIVSGPYILFKISALLFHIIPKRSFVSEQEYYDFVQEATEKWKKKG